MPTVNHRGHLHELKRMVSFMSEQEKFKKFIRSVRQNRGELLYHMADRLYYGYAELSNIENHNYEKFDWSQFFEEYVLSADEQKLCDEIPK